MGGVHHLLVLHWLPGAGLWFTPAAVPVALAWIGILAFLTGGAGRLLHHLTVRGGIAFLPALPALWTALEWLPSVAGDLAFPWLGLPTALVPVPHLLAPAELAGALTVTFWIVAFQGGVVDAWLRGGIRSREGRGWAVAAAFLLLLPAGWSLHRSTSLELVSGPRVAALSLPLPERPMDSRARAEEAVRDARAALEAMEPDGIALVVWPEAAVPLLLDRPEGDPYLRGVRALASGTGAVQLLGGYVARDGPLNALVVVGLEEDGWGPVYGKRRLVPGVEAVPGPLGRIPGSDREVIAGAGHAFRPGTGPGVLAVGHLRLGPLVCWEAAFRGPVRAAVRAGADLLVNGTNDSFFHPPGAPEGWGWAGRRQHEAHLVLRAVETRRPAIRSATAGGAFVLDPVGRVVAGAPAGWSLAEKGGVVVAPVLTAGTHSLFTRVGIDAGLAAFLLLLALAMVAGRRGTEERARRST